MRRKTVAFLALLIFTASAFAVTSTLPETTEDGNPLDIVGFIRSLGRPVFALCDPVGGGGGGGSD
jgi:hypothetical protein